MSPANRAFVAFLDGWAVLGAHAMAVDYAAQMGYPRALTEGLTEDEVIRDYVGDPMMVQMGLCKAAGLGYNRALRKQLARGAKKNGTNHQNDTAIHLAAASGQTDTVNVLLKWGVKFDEPSHSTWDFGTPMHAAAARGHAPVVALLLEAGAWKFLPEETNKIVLRGITLQSVWDVAKPFPAVLAVLKEHRARKNWSKVRSRNNMKKLKTLSIYWFWLDQAARAAYTNAPPIDLPFMKPVAKLKDEEMAPGGKAEKRDRAAYEDD